MQVNRFSLGQKDTHALHGLRSWLFLLVGLGILLSLSSFVAWRGFIFWRQPKAWPLLILSTLAYLVSLAILRQFQRLPRARTVGLVLVTVSLVFAVVVVVIALGRLYYSRSFLMISYVTTLIWFLLAFEFWTHSKALRLAVVPGGTSKDLLSQLRGVDWVELETPNLPTDVDGVVVDWHEKISSEWIRLLSNCSLRRLPVYHAAVVFESATGKISLAHLSDGLIEEFRLPPIYAAFKRVVDVTVVLLVAPILLPLVTILAMIIRLNSPGAALFWQERVGQGGQVFRMCKFRSMNLDAEGAGASFAQCRDRRVTTVGRWIRASRFDELPQFWNVLKGEMSLIGPRPEQVPFAKKFSEEIAFYGYRHLVKPGISGWAQVNRGYASDTLETRDKLEYDLYYIKYFSLWLDALILVKTFRIIITGDGAR